jgi:hypothetical protein
MALTARSLHCRDSVRLQSYFHRPYEPVSMPARDPQQSSDKRFAVGKTRPFADTRWWRRLRVREALRHEGLNLHQLADTVPRYCLN